MPDLYAISVKNDSEIDSPDYWYFTFYNNCPPIPRTDEIIQLDNKGLCDVEAIVRRVEYSYEWDTNAHAPRNAVGINIYVALLRGGFPDV